MERHRLRSRKAVLAGMSSQAGVAFNGTPARCSLVSAGVLANLECRAAASGAEHLFGDTLRSNDAMLHLARKSGYAFVPTPGDWKQVRFEKHIDVAPQDIPCASWRLMATDGQAAAWLA